MEEVNSMTVRERVLASRLIQKIDGNKDYAKNIGLSYVSAEDSVAQSTKMFHKKRINNNS